LEQTKAELYGRLQTASDEAIDRLHRMEPASEKDRLTLTGGPLARAMEELERIATGPDALGAQRDVRAPPSY